MLQSDCFVDQDFFMVDMTSYTTTTSTQNEEQKNENGKTREKKLMKETGLSRS